MHLKYRIGTKSWTDATTHSCKNSKQSCRCYKVTYWNKTMRMLALGSIIVFTPEKTGKYFNHLMSFFPVAWLMKTHNESSKLTLQVTFKRIYDILMPYFLLNESFFFFLFHFEIIIHYFETAFSLSSSRVSFWNH